METKKKKRKLSTTGKVIVGVFCALLVLLVGLGVHSLVGSKKSDKGEVATETASAEATESSNPSLSEKYDALYEEYHTLNSDYVGKLEFKNNLLYNYPEDCEDQYGGLIVKSYIIEDGQGDVNAANAEYLRTDITKSSMDFGQEFMDGSNVLDENNLPTDQNIIIYGHFVYRDHNLKFGPLHEFEDASNYDTYDTFTLTFNHEQRTYVVTDAFFYEKDSFTGTREESPFAPNYSSEQLTAYMNKVKNEYDNSLDTGITITDQDNFVTLQTCVENREDLLYIVLGKEIKRETFD